MSLFKKTVSFLAIMACAPAVYAVTARPSVVTQAAASSRLRMPTMTATINSTSGTTVSGGSTTNGLLSNTECIEAYTSCMKGGDACGSDFEECTTKVLFHGKMPQCLSTLAQCSTSGVNALFGTSSVTSLSAVATKNSYGEVTDYTYPTDGSALGQLITGAAISHKYDTGTCVKRYTSCLKKDSVCGDDFELCTTNNEFKKQMVFCESTLARCQSEGKIRLFGSATTTVAPKADSHIGQMISEGASLAAVNAVSTCYKVVDQCILNACATNPYRCNENASTATAELVEDINNGGAAAASNDAVTSIVNTISGSAVSGYIKNACLDTIGSNKYCYATFLGDGQMPSGSQLSDADNQEEIFDEAYGARMNTSMKSKIADLVDKFDTKAKSKCVDTIKSCAMRVCGSGSGAACYSQVFGARDKSINNSVSYAEIKTGCADIVNTDTYCKYAAANPNASGPYSYAYINTSAFDTLFPEYEEGGADPIGVIASLNASLATSYSDAAIAQMKKQCQSVATSCVKSLCGADYVNCYRNRTDIYSNLTSTGDSAFDKSMNKVGGVLDYTIVLGLCLDTVKNASVCEEHLAIEQNKIKMNNKSSTSVWGGASSVRSGWIDAGSATAVTAETEQVAAIDENGNALCTTKGGMDQGTCYTVDAAGNVYDQPVMISYTTYVQSQAASSLFKDLVYDLEKEAQAKYNAKLTKEQNMCMSSNSGGILGNRDTGSTYMWAKLKSNRTPKNYSVNGLKPSQFAASNDLYGSFCRVRVTLQSEDKNIQEAIRAGTDWANAYFAVGDTFTCGSWIPSSALESIANAVASDATADKRASQNRTRNWLTALGVVGGGVGGAFLGNAIQEGNILGSLTGIGDNKKAAASKEKNIETCTSKADSATSALRSTATYNDAIAYADAALVAARKLNIESSATTNLNNALANFSAAMNTTGKEQVTQTTQYEISVINNAKAKLPGLRTLLMTEEGKGERANQQLIKQYRDQIKSLEETANTPIYTATDVVLKNNASNAAARAAAMGDTVSQLQTALSTVRDACAKADDKGDGKDGEDKKNTKWIAPVVGSVVTSVAGGFLMNRAVKDIQQSNLDSATKAAYQEWMNSVGSKIHCYIGADEAGDYGDIITTSIE